MLILLYPACHWFRAYKLAHRDTFLKFIGQPINNLFEVTVPEFCGTLNNVISRLNESVASETKVRNA
jgi:hypothetical protein